MNAKFALITFLDGAPGVPVGPDNTLPGSPVYPGNALPGVPGQPVQLPVYPFDPTMPDNTLPGGGTPDNSLPVPGKRYIVRWLACVGLILVPDNELPPAPAPK